jgi:hypothetical protein
LSVGDRHLIYFTKQNGPEKGRITLGAKTHCDDATVRPFCFLVTRQSGDEGSSGASSSGSSAAGRPSESGAQQLNRGNSSGSDADRSRRGSKKKSVHSVFGARTPHLYGSGSSSDGGGVLYLVAKQQQDKERWMEAIYSVKTYLGQLEGMSQPPSNTGSPATPSGRKGSKRGTLIGMISQAAGVGGGGGDADDQAGTAGGKARAETSSKDSGTPTGPMLTNADKKELWSQSVAAVQQDREDSSKIFVKVEQARNLKAADLNGKSDPYAVVTIGKQITQTR